MVPFTKKPKTFKTFTIKVVKSPDDKTVYTISRPTSLPTTELCDDAFSRMDHWDNELYYDLENQNMEDLIVSGDSGDSIRQKWDTTCYWTEFQKQNVGIQKAWGRVVEAEEWFKTVTGSLDVWSQGQREHFGALGPREPFGPPGFTRVFSGTLPWPFGTPWIDGTTYYLPGMFGPSTFGLGYFGTPGLFYGPPPGIPTPPGLRARASPLFGYPTLDTFQPSEDSEASEEDTKVKNDIPNPYRGLRDLLNNAPEALRGILKPSGSFEAATVKKKVKFDIPLDSEVVKSPLEKLYGLAIDVLLGDLSELM